MTIAGRVWKLGAYVDTEVILPTPVLTRPRAEQSAHVLGAARPGWAHAVTAGDVIVAGEAFGIGSGRPAPRALKDLGIAAIVAESVAGLFLRGAIAEGLPVITVPGVANAFDEGDVLDFDTDRWVVSNRRTGERFAGQRLPERLAAMMLNGGVMPFLLANGYVAPAS